MHFTVASLDREKIKAISPKLSPTFRVLTKSSLLLLESKHADVGLFLELSAVGWLGVILEMLLQTGLSLF